MKSRTLFLVTTMTFFAAATLAYTEEDDDKTKKANTEELTDEGEADEDIEKAKTTSSQLPPPPSVTPDTPTSPQAQVFARLGDYSMNNSSGIPDIGIPLFQIDYYGFTIPLNLRYEAQPQKPGYNYDVFGLGWTLSGNSCVSRTIHDRADEDGRYGNPFELDRFVNSDETPFLFRDHASELDKFNLKYDSYCITLPSGRNIPFFMYVRDGILTYNPLTPDRDVRIVCNYSSAAINSFVVTDEDGVTYTFDVADKATNTFIDDNNALRNVAWLLSRIDIPFKGIK